MYSYASSVYTLETTAAQTVVFVQSNGLYYSGTGSDNLQLPAIAFYDYGSGQIAGTFLPGATHHIYYLSGAIETLVGSYTYTELAIDGVLVTLPDSAEYLRMCIASAACGVFQETTDYELPPVVVVTYATGYNNETEAAADSVAPCEFYRLFDSNDYDMNSPSSRALVKLTSGCADSSYANEAAAAADSVALGEVFALSVVNDYDLMSPLSNLLMVRTDGGSVTTYKGPFANDSDAASGGVVLWEAYMVSAINDYDYPSNGQVLVVRTS